MHTRGEIYESQNGHQLRECRGSEDSSCAKQNNWPNYARIGDHMKYLGFDIDCNLLRTDCAEPYDSIQGQQCPKTLKEDRATPPCATKTSATKTTTSTVSAVCLEHTQMLSAATSSTLAARSCPRLTCSGCRGRSWIPRSPSSATSSEIPSQTDHNCFTYRPYLVGGRECLVDTIEHLFGVLVISFYHS